MRDAGYPYVIDPVTAHRGVHTVVRGLARGATVLLLFDPLANQSRGPVRRRSWARHCGWREGWRGWPCASAPVLPVSIRIECPGRYCLEIHDPLTERERSTEGTILATLARALERQVLARPTAWLKWKDFHVMVEDGSGHASQEMNHG